MEEKHQEEISGRQIDDLASVRSDYEAKLNAKEKEAYERIEKLTSQIAELESRGNESFSRRNLDSILFVRTR